MEPLQRNLELIIEPRPHGVIGLEDSHCVCVCVCVWCARYKVLCAYVCNGQGVVCVCGGQGVVCAALGIYSDVISTSVW